MLHMDSSHCCTQYVMYDALDSFIKLIKYSKSDKTQRLISEYIYQMKLENKTANYF